MGEKRYHRAIWLSDIYLGTRGCKAEFLLDFLRANDSDVLYLVGDIIDGWALKRSWYWDQHHNDVIQKLLRKARKGTRVYYIPGNHDEFARDYVDTLFGGVTVKSHAIHDMLDGAPAAGDAWRRVRRHHPLCALAGGARRHVLPVRAVAQPLVQYPASASGISLLVPVRLAEAQGQECREVYRRFEAVVAREAATRQLDGVVCGHIHKAEIRNIDGILYCNDGDWVESCTALVETIEGELEIVHWTDTQATVVRLDLALEPASAA